MGNRSRKPWNVKLKKRQTLKIFQISSNMQHYFQQFHSNYVVNLLSCDQSGTNNCTNIQSQTVKLDIMLVMATSINNCNILLCKNEDGKSHNLQKNKQFSNVAKATRLTGTNGVSINKLTGDWLSREFSWFYLSRSLSSVVSSISLL